MIGVYFKGRLGNQLFQYVFFKYLKERSGDKMVFFQNPHHAYLSKYFELDKWDNITISSKIYSAFSRVIPILLRFKNTYVHSFVNPREIEPKNFHVYHGYFQTDFYYNLLHSKPQFIIKEFYQKRFDNLFGEIFKKEKTIAVHIRRTDYLSYGKRDISLPIEYFQERLAEIDNIGEYKVFFVSDDLDFVKKTFSQKENYIFSDNDEITDFQIIQNADIAIISNSSFGWWAAYLSKKKNKVYAPENWLGFRIGVQHPKKVMTEKFTWERYYRAKNKLSNHLSIE